MTLLLKDPSAALDYAVDWGKQYLNEDAIAQSDWSVDPVEEGGITIIGSQFDATVATVNAGGGRSGRLYRLTNRIVLESGLTDSRSIQLRVETR